MKNFTFIFLIFVFSGVTIPFVTFAQAPDWTRVLQINTHALPNINVVTTDVNNVYFAGKISGTITFNGINYTNVGNSDLIICKMSNTGEIDWVKQFNAEALGIIIPDALGVDTDGNIFLAASLWHGTITIGVTTITQNEFCNAFYAKFDASGNVIWATPFFSTTSTGTSKIAFDASGNSFLLSRTSKLAKFNSSGILLWEQDFPYRTLQTLAIYGSDLYLGGTLQGGTTYFGTIPLTSLGGYNTGFMVKADLNGVYNNSLVVGGPGYNDGSSVSDIVLDNIGNLIITGSYQGEIVLGDITITNPNYSYYTYIAKCDNNFDFSWAKSSSEIPYAINNRQMWAYRIFLDNSDNIYEYGIINSPFTFGNVTLNLLPENQFLIKFDANGNALNGYALENTSYDRTIVSGPGKVLAGGGINYEGSTAYGNFYITQFNNNLVQDWQKVSSNSLSGIAKINYVKHDAAGNTYIQARIIGHCDYFGAIINTNYYFTVISKHDINGNLLWMNQIADISPYLFGQAFALDKDNNILTVGLFHSTLNIGNTTLTSSNSENEGYVAKYSSNGSFVWASKMDLNANVSDRITVAPDNSGNILVTGVLSPANYLVKFDALGNQLWAQVFPMESYYFSLVSADTSNNIYMASEIHLSDATGSTTIGNITLTQTYDDGSTVLIKFDADGNALWAKTYGGVAGATYSDGWPCDIKTDSNGNLYLWGWCANNSIFGATILINPFTTNQNYSYFLTKINTSGNVVWANAVYKKKYAINYGDLLDLDNNGNIYVGGHFRDSISIEGTEYFPEGVYDFFACKYSNTGVFQWIKTIPANTRIINALSVHNENVLSFGGSIGKNSTLGGINITSTTGSNCMIATLGNLPLQVTDIENGKVQIYPNPATNILFIEGFTQSLTASIFDINGKMLINKQGLNNQIDISSLSDGIYIIKFTTENGIVTQKFVKQ